MPSRLPGADWETSRRSCPGEAGRVVAGALLNDLRGDACLGQKGNVHMPCVVQPDRRQSCVLHGLLERLGEELGHDGQPVGVAEHQLGLWVAMAERELFFDLALALSPQHRHRLRRRRSSSREKRAVLRRRTLTGRHKAAFLTALSEGTRSRTPPRVSAGRGTPSIKPATVTPPSPLPGTRRSRQVRTRSRTKLAAELWMVWRSR
jgi:hypothetical protein